LLAVFEPIGVFVVFGDIRVEFIGSGNEEKLSEKVFNRVSLGTTFGFGNINILSSGSEMKGEGFLGVFAVG
jgi:hypothetical protein